MADQFHQHLSDDEVEEYALARDSGPIVTMMRRLKDSLVAHQQATNRLTWVLIVLTIVILLLTAVTAAPLIVRFFS